MNISEYKGKRNAIYNTVLDDLKDDTVSDFVYLLVLIDERGGEPEVLKVFGHYRNLECQMKTIRTKRNEAGKRDASERYMFWRIEKYVFIAGEYKRILSCDFKYCGKLWRFIGDGSKYNKIDKKIEKLDNEAISLFKTGDIVKLSRNPVRADCYGIYGLNGHGNSEIMHLDDAGELVFEVFLNASQLDIVDDCDDEWLCQTSEKIKANPDLFVEMSNEIADKIFSKIFEA